MAVTKCNAKHPVVVKCPCTQTCVNCIIETTNRIKNLILNTTAHVNRTIILLSSILSRDINTKVLIGVAHTPLHLNELKSTNSTGPLRAYTTQNLEQTEGDPQKAKKWPR
jgi:hypothetical protein